MKLVMVLLAKAVYSAIRPALALHSQRQREAAAQQGAAAYIPKPFNAKGIPRSHRFRRPQGSHEADQA